MPSTSFTVSLTSGYVYGTEFVFTNTSTDRSLHRYIWNLNDNSNFKYSESITHIFEYPGLYNVTLSSIRYDGYIETFTQNISVDYLYRDYISFTEIPDTYSDPGLHTNKPFKIKVVSSQPKQPLNVNLFVANSKSIPYQEIANKKWNFLIPSWKFLDKNKNFITSLSVAPEPIFYNNKVVGVSGTQEFYFIDSISTNDPLKNCPLLITATLQTSSFIFNTDSSVYDYYSYANNKSVTTGITWFINDITPDLLKITGNYIDDIYPLKWVDVKIPIMITYHSNRSLKLPDADNTISEILFGHPSTNALGSITPLKLNLQDKNFTPFVSSDQIVENEPLYFQKTDSNVHDIGGYIFTTITSKQSADQATITGYTTAYVDYTDYINQQFPYPGAYSPQPTVWISNPTRNTLNKITYLPYPNNCEAINYYKENKLLVDGYIKQVNVPSIVSDSTYNYYMSGFSGIYSMAIDPRRYELIAADGELDCIYKFSTEGQLLSTLQLSTVPGIGNYAKSEQGLTPGSLSLDKDYNIWVTLFNSVSVLKFDKNFNFLFVTVPTYLENYDEIFDGDFIYKPPVVQTDKENNAWVAYSHPLCSTLVSYDKDGYILTNITLPQYSSPVDLAIDSQNNVWVANSYNTLNPYGSIIQFKNSGELLNFYQGFTRPSYLAIDRDNNIWFTHGIKNIGVINPQTQTQNLWQVNNNESQVTFTPLPSYSYIDDSEFQDDEIIGGFAIDVYNRIWYINSYNNYAWTLSATTNLSDLTARAFKIKPDSTIGYYTEITSGTTIIDENNNYKSAQAFGDWTGNQWYQKYTNILTLSARAISGISIPFEISKLQNFYEIRKVNDSFNMSEYFESLAYPEILKNNNTLFNVFLPTVLGTGDNSYYQDIGRTAYEKIANFVINNADIETCNIDKLLNFAEQTATPKLNYDLDLPIQIKNLLDLTSIHKSKLWGQKETVPTLNESLSSVLNPLTDVVTVNSFIVLKNKYDGTLYLVKVPPQLNENSVEFITEESTYPLSGLQLPDFIQPLFNNYLIYKYAPQYPQNFVENIIDWDSEFTTLSPSQSSSKEWFGDNGIVEKNFHYYLLKNLVE